MRLLWSNGTQREKGLLNLGGMRRCEQLDELIDPLLNRPTLVGEEKNP